MNTIQLLQSRIINIAGTLVLSAFCFLLSALSLEAAPTLTVGSVSGQTGTSVTLPITFDPTTALVTAMQFDLTLPTGLSTGMVVTLNPAINNLTFNTLGGD